MWSGLSTTYAVNSVYGFKDDAPSLYDEEGKVSDEASLAQKDHRTLGSTPVFRIFDFLKLGI